MILIASMSRRAIFDIQMSRKGSRIRYRAYTIYYASPVELTVLALDTAILYPASQDQLCLRNSTR